MTCYFSVPFISNLCSKYLALLRQKESTKESERGQAVRTVIVLHILYIIIEDSVFYLVC